jgi:hypothetical protein
VWLQSIDTIGFYPRLPGCKYRGLPDKMAVSPILFFMLFFVFPFYSIVPLFFIACWLAKEVENGTMQTMEESDATV